MACTVVDPSEEPLRMPAASTHGSPGRALAGARRHYTIEAMPTGIPFGRSHASKAICAGDGIVGSATMRDINESRPVLYADGVLTDIGTPVGRVGEAHDGNALGEIVGTSALAGPTPGSSGPGSAFLYRDGVLRELPGIGGVFSEAWAINEREVIVGSATIPGEGDVPSHAVVWENCVPTDLGGLGGTDSFARGINDAGVIVGAAVLATHHARAVLWRDKVIEDLGAGDALDSQARGINAAGTIAGFTQRPDRAAIWRDGALTTLPTLGGEHAFALDLNERGEVVGASTDAGEARFHAFLYADGSTLDLEALVGAPGWQLLEADDICDDGRIVGDGLLDGIPRGFILTPAP